MPSSARMGVEYNSQADVEVMRPEANSGVKVSAWGTNHGSSLAPRNLSHNLDPDGAIIPQSVPPKLQSPNAAMPPPPPPPQSSAFRQSLAPTSAYARHLSHATAQTTLYADPPLVPPRQRTERDILLSHHRFLATPTTDASYENALVAAYDNKLYKEFVLMSLSRWREGMVAMRWRTEEEVKMGKGVDMCAELECNKEASDEQEVLFAYAEDGEQKEALVKARLCGRCREKLVRAREREKRDGEKREDRSRSRNRSRRTKDWGERRNRRKRRSRSPHADANEGKKPRQRRRRG